MPTAGRGGPWQCRAVGVGGIGRGQYDRTRRWRGGPQPVDRAGDGELSRPEGLYEVAAPASAGIFECRQDAVHPGEAAWDPFGCDRTAGDDPIPFEHRFGLCVGSQRRIRITFRQQGPAAGDRRWAAAARHGRTRDALVAPVGTASTAQRGSQWGEGVVGDQARPHQVPQGACERGVVETGDPVGQGPEEQRSLSVEGRQHRAVQRGAGGVRYCRGQQQGRGVRWHQGHPAVVAGQAAGPCPQYLARHAQLIKECRAVARHPARQDELFPGAGRDKRTLKLFDGPGHRVDAVRARTAAPGRDPLPAWQKPGEHLDGYRLDSTPRRREAAPAKRP